MSVSLFANPASLNILRNLETNKSKHSESLAKLSSGKRVNSIKDDIASYCIAAKMSVSLNAMKQSLRNIQQAGALLDTADGGLNQISNNLRRIKEIIIEATDTQKTGEEKALLNQELYSLKTEIGRIARTTEFNGKKMLNGQDITHGSFINNTILSKELGVNAVFVTKDSLGSSGFVQFSYAPSNLLDSPFAGKMTATLIDANNNVVQTEVAELQNNKIVEGNTEYVAFNKIGVAVELNNVFDKITEIPLAPTVGSKANLSNSHALEVDGSNTFIKSISGSIEGITDAILQVTDTTQKAQTANLVLKAKVKVGGQDEECDFTAQNVNLKGTDPINIQLTRRRPKELADDVINIQLKPKTSDAVDDDTFTDLRLATFSSLGQSLVLFEEHKASATFDFKITESTDPENNIGISLASISPDSLQIDGLSVDTSDGLDIINRAISTVESVRNNISSTVNRLNAAANVVETSRDNLNIAIGSLINLDVPEEMQQNAMYEMLVNAGISMLAKDNESKRMLAKLFA